MSSASSVAAAPITSARRAPPQLYFLVSAVFHYLGPAFAVLLFARVEVLGVAWLRIVAAAVIFAFWRRPWRAFAAQDREGKRLLIAWGSVLAIMNACFYTAIDRLPLGTVAAIEFLPVVGLAALGARTVRNAAALALAVPGVYILTDVQLRAQPLGLVFAFANALLFASYIVLADRVAKRPELSGIDGLAAAMLIAAAVITPIAGRQALPAFADPLGLLAGIGVGVCSSVIPYVADQLALTRLARATYALMVSLLPATATVIGIVVLTQIPTVAQLAGVALVIVGVALHREPVALRAIGSSAGAERPGNPEGRHNGRRMVPEAKLEGSEGGLAPAGEGWFVLNAREARWLEGEFGAYTRFEGDVRFPQFGFNIGVLDPGQPACMYHGEDEQEDFLVLAGECLLLIEGEERSLKAWDFVHCPAHTEHVIVGAGDGPCVVLAVGSRSDGEVIYPVSELALRYRAGVETETHKPSQAYADIRPDTEVGYRQGWLPH